MASLPVDKAGIIVQSTGRLDDGFPLVEPQAQKSTLALKGTGSGVFLFSFISTSFDTIGNTTGYIHSKVLAKYGHLSGDLFPEDSQI